MSDRSCTAPCSWLLDAHGVWATAALGAGASVLVNNLPAAVLFSAQPPVHPQALLLGLDLGPNLTVTGSLSALLWLRAARIVDARPSIATYTRLGLFLASISLAATLAVSGAATVPAMTWWEWLCIVAGILLAAYTALVGFLFSAGRRETLARSPASFPTALSWSVGSCTTHACRAAASSSCWRSSATSRFPSTSSPNSSRLSASSTM
jgi:hypothetical protein